MDQTRPNISSEEARELVGAALATFLVDTHRVQPAAGVSAGTAVFGPGGVLDSLGLVGFIADVETRVGEHTGLDVVLADERAMSRSRSPFRSVESLAELVLERLAEMEPGAPGSQPS